VVMLMLRLYATRAIAICLTCVCFAYSTECACMLCPQDVDVSIRRRALDLLFTMCDQSNSSDIVHELLKYLTVTEFSMREELVLKIAILAEKFAPSVPW
jgi:AP-2 complex subunit alpha